MSATAFAASSRQLCLACHPPHYAQRSTCTGCHRGNPTSDRKNIAHHRMIAGRYAAFTLGDTRLLQNGENLLKQYACRRCHVIGGKGNRLSINLDQSTARKQPEELEASILHPVRNMPDFRLEKPVVVVMVNVLLSAAVHGGTPKPAGPQVVHFDQAGRPGQDLFSKKCGLCHRALTVRLGGVGQGDSGPNLSGLLTPHYPETFRGNGRWTEHDLTEWLKNPRKIRPLTGMLPVVLTEAEFRELVDILRMDAAEGK